MKFKNFTFIKRSALLFSCGLLISNVTFSQIGETGDYSNAVQVVAGAEIGGKYVIELAVSPGLYMGADKARDNNDSTTYATGDMSDCYAFDIVKGEDDLYTMKSGNMVLDFTHGWLVDVLEESVAVNKGWDIQFVEGTDFLSIARANGTDFIKYEPNGTEGLVKFYSDWNESKGALEAPKGYTFTFYKVPETNAVNTSSLKSVSIYPNPVSEALYINNISGKSAIKVTNSMGQNVYNSVVNNATVIPVSSWNKGIYFVQINQEVHKVMVK